MNQSLFSKYVDLFFPKLATLIEKINGKKNGVLTYLHKDTSILRREYSADNKWEADTIHNSYVAADYVAMDSPVPLKKRPSLSQATGKLPKIGIRRDLNESRINQLNIMEAQGGNKAEIARKLAQDAIFCATGLDEKNEYAFLSAIYDGAVAIKDEEADADTTLRLDFGYLSENTFGVKTAGAFTLPDFQGVIDKADADGTSILEAWISKAAYDALRKTDDAKILVANYNGQTVSNVNNLPVPTATRFEEAFRDQYGFGFRVIDRKVRIEKNGVEKTIKPFGNARIIFTCNQQVGAFVYGRLAEMTHKVNGVDYQTIDGYKLIAKFSETNPLIEKTTGQAMCTPIIENPDEIYILDSTMAIDGSADTEGDTYINLWSNKYPKAGFVTALKKYTACNANATDATVIAKVGTLSKADQDALKADVESIKITAG